MTVDVLLIEDDDDVREHLAEALVDAGYSLDGYVDAAGGFASLDAIGKPRIVVTDINLPGGIDGISFGRAAQQRYPDLGVVYISGGASQIADLGPNERFLAKPFRIKALVCAIRETLA